MRARSGSAAAAPQPWPGGAVARFSLLLWLTYAYFIPSPSWNPNARFNLTLALVEQGQLAIDAYHVNTGDKATKDGRHYSDKAPGVSFWAAPAYAVFAAIWERAGGDRPRVLAVGRNGHMDPRAVRGDGEDDVLLNPAYRWGQYVATVFTSGLAGAAIGGVMLGFAQRLGRGRRGATAIAMATCLGTLIFPYATTFYGHVPAAALALAAFALVARVDDGEAQPASWGRLFLSGLLAGAAVACEYPAVLASIAVAAVAAAGTPPGGRLRLLAWPLGLAVPLSLLAFYNVAAFGNLLQVGYTNLARADFRAGMANGVAGISWPSVRAFAGTLWGRERGLFYTSPILALALWGLMRNKVRNCRLGVRRLCLLVFGSFVLLSSGYYMWWGGSALGPRHVIPSLGFLMLGLVWTWPQATAPESQRRWWKEQGSFALLALSVLNMTLGTAVGPEAPRTTDVLFRHVYPLAATGRVPHAPGASNLGRLLGLPGMLSLLPLVALWLVYISRVWSLIPSASKAPEATP